MNGALIPWVKYNRDCVLTTHWGYLFRSWMKNWPKELYRTFLWIIKRKERKKESFKIFQKKIASYVGNWKFPVILSVDAIFGSHLFLLSLHFTAMIYIFTKICALSMHLVIRFFFLSLYFWLSHRYFRFFVSTTIRWVFLINSYPYTELLGLVCGIVSLSLFSSLSLAING